MQLHHATLFVRDAERSTRFYRDGLGLDVLVDRDFDGDWAALLGVDSKRLRAIILGDPTAPHVGQVELVTFAEPLASGPAPGVPATATVMLSFQVDLRTVLPTLERLGAAEHGRTTLSNGNAVATVRDPDGIMVELIDTGSRTVTEA